MKLRKPPIRETVPLDGPSSLAIREFRRPSFADPFHEHPEVEMTWILRGSGLRYVGSSVEPFHAGDCCLIGPRLPHAWLSAPGRSPGGVRSLVVQFDPAGWGGLLDLIEFAPVADLLARAQAGLHFPKLAAERWRALMKPSATPVERWISLLRLLDGLAREGAARPLCASPAAFSRRTDRRLRDVLAHLADHASETVRQSDAARIARLSPAAFSRFFQRNTGRTFSAYLTELRIGEACRQLVESGRSITEIAFSSGFANLSTFNRAFRHLRGMPPGQFRRSAIPAEHSRPE